MANDQPHTEIQRPRLRWFQFRLRTMFVLMTLFALWFGHEMDFIHERTVLRQQIEATGGFVEEGSLWISAIDEKLVISTGNELGEIPDYRRWLGDRPATGIYLPSDFPELDVARVIAHFPDARIAREPARSGR